MAAVVSGLMAKLESVLWVPAGTTGVARRWRWRLPRQREEPSTLAVEAAALRQVPEPPGQQRRAPRVCPRPRRRPRGPAQSACTTRPDDHPSPGAVQSARGRLPGAKIGVDEALDRAGGRVHGYLKRPPGEHRAEERLIAPGGGGRGDLAEVGYGRGDLSLLGGGRGLADLGDRLPCLPFALLAGERAGLERQRRRPIRCVRLASGGMPVRAMDRHRGSRLHLPRGRNHATHITLLGHEHTAARDQFVRPWCPMWTRYSSSCC
jgi:hypothetical protein